MSKLIDIRGQNYGYWHVLEDYDPIIKNGKTYWKCQCTLCNKTIKFVSSYHLRSGMSKSCGCYRNQQVKKAVMKHEEGKIYGYLKVIREAYPEEKPRSDKTGVYWNCTCLNCGKENVIVFGDYLRNGDTRSCGCITSVNESKIAKMLDELNIKYIKQYHIKNFFSYYYDFGIIDEDNNLLYLIEYDGIQHFDDAHEHFHSSLSEIRERDLTKNQYCFKNNIPLIRIPYNKEYNSNDLILESTRFLITIENEEKYYRME